MYLSHGERRAMVTLDTERFEETFQAYSQIGRTENDGLHTNRSQYHTDNRYFIAVKYLGVKWFETRSVSSLSGS